VEWDNEGPDGPPTALLQSPMATTPHMSTTPTPLSLADSARLSLNSSASFLSSSGARKEGSRGFVCLGKWCRKSNNNGKNSVNNHVADGDEECANSGTELRVACKKLKQVKKRLHFYKEIAAQMLLEYVIKPDRIVPKIYGFLNDDILVMEEIDGQSLYDYLDTGGFLSLKQFSVLVDYLRHLSCWGLEHGDLHGGNIMLVSPPCEDSRIVVIDYGRASVSHHRHHYDDAAALYNLLKCGALGNLDRFPKALQVKKVLEEYMLEREKMHDRNIVDENYKKFEEVYWILNKEGTAPMTVYTPNGIRRSIVDIPIKLIDKNTFAMTAADGSLTPTDYDGKSPIFRVFGKSSVTQYSVSN